MYEGIEVTYLTPEQLEYIWDNMRAHDLVELTAFGLTKENSYSELQTCDETMCGTKDGVPIAVFGYITTPRTIRFNFFATEQSAGLWKTMTRMAKSYIQANMRAYPQLRPIIEVWEGHSASRRWLARFGFEETRAYRHTKQGRMIFMEHRRRQNLQSA